MSNLVTDTYALIWYLEDSPNLSLAANEAFDKCDRGEIIIYIPTICLVEIVYLQERRGISKVPTFSIYQLVDGEYQISQFRANDCIISPTFPDLKITANQIFQAGEVIKD